MTNDGNQRWTFPEGSFEPRNLLRGAAFGLALIVVLMLVVYAL